MEYIVREATDKDLTAIHILFHNSVGKVNISDYNTLQIRAWQGAGSAKRWGELWSSELRFYVAESTFLEIIGFTSFRPDGYIHNLLA